MLTERRFTLIHIAAAAGIASLLSHGQLMLAVVVTMVTSAVVWLLDTDQDRSS